jgi:cation diffusion facilitator CzcD-associated flavoprotein CzcO
MSTHEAVIVGAGFGGMGAAIQLDRLGIGDYVIVDREDDLGGTWHVNRYPGLSVDIASVTYSYSFEPNPDWSRVFAPGAELKRYAEHVADTYDLRRRMRFATTVTGATWDEAQQRWQVGIADGTTLSARYLITATGFLSQPKMPDIPGIDTFAGTVVHTARWDDDVQLAGTRAAIIGTGATAVQLIPELAKEVAELTVYQRTPIWVVPKIDAPIPAVARKLFALAPATQRLARLLNSAALEALSVTGVLHYREARPFGLAVERLARAHLRAQVRDPRTRRELTPSYKRPTFSNTYYRTFNQPHVRLETTSIDRVEPDAIVTTDGRRTAIDVLVLATGFDLWEANFPAVEIIGAGGRDLGKWWRDNRFQAYAGLTVPHFPNLISLNSPYAYTGLSYFWTIETQMKHMARLFGELRRRGATTFDVTEEANREFLDRMTANLDSSVFYNGQCGGSRSYYFDPHGEAALLRPTPVAAGSREAGRFPLDAYAYS